MNLLLDSAWLWVCLAWTATGIVAGHYFVDKFDLFTDGIALTARYIIGTLTWLVPLTIFLVEILHAPMIAGLVWAFVIVAGVTDIAIYFVDELDIVGKLGKWLQERLHIA